MESSECAALNVIKEEPVEFLLILPPEIVKTEKEMQFQLEDQAQDKRKKFGGTTSESRRFQCDKCERSYKQRLGLTNHRKSHSEYKFHCDFCDYKAYRKNFLNNHMNKHKTDFKLKCPECFRFFKDPQAVKFHQNRIHSSKKKLFTAKI